jgi:hypothetical protein
MKTDLKEIISKIPQPLVSKASDRLANLVLNSKNAKKIPNRLAKNILYDWQTGQHETSDGLERLIEAALIVEPEKTSTFLQEEMGIPEEVVKTNLV